MRQLTEGNMNDEKLEAIGVELDMASECVNCEFLETEHINVDGQLICPDSVFKSTFVPPVSKYPYFDMLSERPDLYVAESLRDAGRLPLLTSKHEERAVSYDPVVDAARITIPAFGFEEAPMLTVSTAVPDGDINRIPLMSVANVVHSTQYKKDSPNPDVISEIVKTGPSSAYRDTTTNEMICKRGMYGTQIQGMSAGTKFWRAMNSTYNQIWVPFNIPAGHSLFASWDSIHGRNWLRCGIGAMKTWQIEGDGSIYFEPQVVLGGNLGNIGNIPGFDPDVHVGVVSSRCYSAPMGTTVDNSPCRPMTNQFLVYPDRIMRWFVRIELGINPQPMRVTMWVADETREPVLILDGLTFTARQKLNRWRAEFNTSTNYLPDGRVLPWPSLGLDAFRPMISWTRNVAILQDVPPEDIPGLLVKPELRIQRRTKWQTR